MRIEDLGSGSLSDTGDTRGFPARVVGSDACYRPLTTVCTYTHLNSSFGEASDALSVVPVLEYHPERKFFSIFFLSYNFVEIPIFTQLRECSFDLSPGIALRPLYKTDNVVSLAQRS